jgi:D-glycero-D-manno-heptose 1,7-bisphosphate phosphatase
MLCHDFLQSETNYSINDIYVAPMHPSVSESLLRKPDSLMFEKAIAKYNIDPQTSWMIGDSERDLIAAAKVGISGYFIKTRKDFPAAKKRASSLLEAVKNIIGTK